MAQEKPEVLSRQDLLAALRTRFAALGVTVREDGDGLSGEAKAILSKWWLGGRTVTYRMLCRFSDVEHALLFREAVAEKSWGLPPPTASVDRQTVAGWRLSGERTDRTPGGGGTINYGRVRQSVEQETTAAGWKFKLEGGRWP